MFGIPFDFTAKPVVAPPQKPTDTVQVKAVSPERDDVEIRFPRVVGYRKQLSEERLEASFTKDSTLVLTPDLVGPTITHSQGIIGEGHDMTVEHLGEVRQSTLVYELTKRLLEKPDWRADGAPNIHLFGQFKHIVRTWLTERLVCQGGTYPAQLMVAELADLACEKITAAITRAQSDEHPVEAILDPYNPVGTTRGVNFRTSRRQRYRSGPRSHLNWAILDSTWEGEFCRVLDAHPQVIAWVKNRNLGFEVPYCLGGADRTYIPDFIVVLDCGRARSPLNVVVEVKGRVGEDTKAKKETMDSYWIPGVNQLACHGRWAFLELRDPYTMGEDFDQSVGTAIAELVAKDRARDFATFLDRIGGSDPDIEDIPRRRSPVAE